MPEITAVEEPEEISMEEFSAAAFTEKPAVAEPKPQLEVPPVQEPLVAEQAGEDETIVLASPSGSEGLDFDFDVDLGKTESAALSKPQESAPAVPALDLSGINLDLGTSEQSAQAAGSEEITLSGSESSDVDTKLDLVNAYIDMGDKEGARELLQEVLVEGGPQQRERAQQMMDSLG